MVHSRSKKNLVTGLLYQVINTAAGLILPFLFITSYGSETNGLLSSIGQLFVYLGLLEAGVGAATLQALYRPLSTEDHEGISAILAATNRYYIKTGIWYSISILLLALIYPFLVDSALSAATIRLVILLQGAGAIVSFFGQAKYTILLQAEGKNYLLNLLKLGESLLRNAGKIAAIALGYDVVAVQAVHFATVCINALIIVSYVRHKYPWLDLKTKPDFKAISQKNSVLVQSIVWIVFNHTDIFVLTVFTRDLALVSVYSLYLLIFEAVQNVNSIVRDSYQYKIGYYSQASKSELSSYFYKYSAINLAFSYASFGAVYYLAAPFVRLYTAGVSDANYMIRWLPELFLIYKILYGIRATNRQLIEAGGHFKATERIAITEAVINLAVSIVLVSFLNIYGVLIGTLAALLYSTFAYTSFVKRFVLDSRFLKSIILHIPNVLVLFGIVILQNRWPINASSYHQLAIKMLLPACLIVFAYAAIAFIQLKVNKRFVSKE